MAETSSTNTSLREQRRAFTRRAIMDAALELISQHGLHQLSLREIAREVGYSPAALYEYFDSKAALVQALSDEGDQLLKAQLAKAPAGMPPDEQLVALGLAYVDFARNHYEHFKLMFSELSTTRTSLNDPLQEDKPYSSVTKAVMDGIDQGLFRAVPHFGVGEIAYGLWALAHGIASLQLTKLRSVDENFPPIDRKVFETFVKGLR